MKKKLNENIKPQAFSYSPAANIWQFFQKCILKVIASRIQTIFLRSKIIFTLTVYIM